MYVYITIHKKYVHFTLVYSTDIVFDVVRKKEKKNMLKVRTNFKEP